MTTITAALTAEHRQGDRFFAAAMQAAEQADWLACHRQFDLFLQALKRHMKIEEEMLFPAFERATGVHDGPTSVMRREHQEMLAMLGEIATAIAARSTVDIRAAMQSFAGRMAAHSAKEERVLYPMCDEMLPDLNGEKLQELISPH